VSARTPPQSTPIPQLRARRLGIDTFAQPVIYVRADSPVCRAEGLGAQTQVEVAAGHHRIVAALHPVHGDLLQTDEAGLSEAAWTLLGATPGGALAVRHLPPIESLGAVRAKIYGHALAQPQWNAIIGDVVAGRYSGLHLAAFVVACAAGRMELAETVGLTRAMVGSGQRLSWPYPTVVDKHCVGGLPGNRTTPIVVSIVAACGGVIPKTSSRAITSPAGTADTMETLAPVDLSLAQLRRVVEQEGGCIAWGGAVGLSPADEQLIRVERVLDLDGQAQLVASVLSKKLAAGSNRVLIDIPVGPTAKVRSPDSARRLAGTLEAAGEALGIAVRCVQTDGRQPVGRGVGPALEAHEVVAVLSNSSAAPADLRERSLALAGPLLEMAQQAPAGQGVALAQAALADGRAWRKFVAICNAQGGLREPGRAPYQAAVPSARAGRVTAIDNRRLARLAKLTGAPLARSAGLVLHRRIGDAVERGEPVLTLHAESRSELGYALEYLGGQPPLQIEGAG
jgi:thymidine phosphorylase